MGAPHDGDEARDLPGGPCPRSKGYLMSSKRRDRKGMHWSRCSKVAMSIFLKSDKADCMRNKPDSGTPYPKILPGRLLSRDEQCKRHLGPDWISYKQKGRNCAVLNCRMNSSETEDSFTEVYRLPAEGTHCGEGAICLDGKCVKDPETL